MSMLDMIDKEPLEVTNAITVAALVFPTMRVGQIITNAVAGRSLFHLRDGDLARAILDYAAEFDTNGLVTKYLELWEEERRDG